MIYFIRPIGFETPIKIGTAKSIEKRLKTLHVMSPFPLEVIASIEGDKTLECRFHERFFDQHRGYEWFDWTPEIQEVIDAINAGTFSIKSLPKAKSKAPLQRGKPSYWSPERRKWAIEATNSATAAPLAVTRRGVSDIGAAADAPTTHYVAALAGEVGL